MKRPVDSFTFDMFAEAMSQPTSRDESFGGGMAAYADDEDMNRLQWWEDASRAEMRADPAWMMVYAHVKMAALMSKALSDAGHSKERLLISSLQGHSERLHWFLENQPGFREEWKLVEAVRRKAEILLAQVSLDRRRADEIYSRRRAHDQVGGVV